MTNGRLTAGHDPRPPKNRSVAKRSIYSLGAFSVVSPIGNFPKKSRTTQQKGNISSFILRGLELELIKCNKCLFTDDNCSEKDFSILPSYLSG